MILEQAIIASSHRLACRVVGRWRVIVDCGRQLPTIQIQYRARRHWVLDDCRGGVRYLAGFVRNDVGSYVCLSNDLTDLVQLRTVLPVHHQALLQPECGDWQAMERGELPHYS